MLKSIFYIILSTAFFVSVVGCKKDSLASTSSEIDDIKSAKEVQLLVRQLDSTFANYEVKRIQDFNRHNEDCEENVRLANQLEVTESFYKTDFDNNGFTDLLVIGDDHSCIASSNQSCSYSPIVVLNFGNKNYKAINISQYFNDYFVPKITKINNSNLLEIYRPIKKNQEQKLVSKNPQKQVLQYKFGDFIEYNSNDKNYIPIKKIEFSTGGCFGACPIFKLIIDKDRHAQFIAEHFNFDDNMDNWSENIEGEFLTTINKNDYQALISTLEYIDFPKLDDNYAVGWTDDQSVTLKITYGNNKVKTIEDYGASGTYGLIKVYKMLFDFRTNQKWIKK